mgnify:FL=1
MKIINKIKIGIGLVLSVVIALFFHYNLPRTAVVQISGTDIKRVDETKEIKERQAETDEQVNTTHHTKDIRYINSVSRKEKPMVFRNYDTGWVWPPYFKFDSADLTAEAQAFSTDQSKPWVLVKYYGWRSTMFTMYPNVLNMKQVNRDYTHIPYFNIVLFILLIALVFYIRMKFNKLVARVRDRNNTNREEGSGNSFKDSKVVKQ